MHQKYYGLNFLSRIIQAKLLENYEVRTALVNCECAGTVGLNLGLVNSLERLAVGVVAVNYSCEISTLLVELNCYACSGSEVIEACGNTDLSLGNCTVGSLLNEGSGDVVNVVLSVDGNVLRSINVLAVNSPLNTVVENECYAYVSAVKCVKYALVNNGATVHINLDVSALLSIVDELNNGLPACIVLVAVEVRLAVLSCIGLACGSRSGERILSEHEVRIGKIAVAIVIAVAVVVVLAVVVVRNIRNIYAESGSASCNSCVKAAVVCSVVVVIVLYIACAANGSIVDINAESSSACCDSCIEGRICNTVVVISVDRACISVISAAYVGYESAVVVGSCKSLGVGSVGLAGVRAVVISAVVVVANVCYICSIAVGICKSCAVCRIVLTCVRAVVITVIAVSIVVGNVGYESTVIIGSCKSLGVGSVGLACVGAVVSAVGVGVVAIVSTDINNMRILYACVLSCLLCIVVLVGESGAGTLLVGTAS